MDGGDKKRAADTGLDADSLWRIQRAEGYLDLTMVNQAGAELDRVSETGRQSLPYAILRIRVLLAREDWPEVVRECAIAGGRWPGESAFPIWQAYATRRAVGIEAAEAILLRAREQFPAEAVIHYNLACYASRQGREKDALALLAKAISMDSKFLRAALDDEDLAPLKSHFDPG